MNWSYIAGFFDGEGNLSISHTGKTYHLLVRLYSSDINILNMIQEFSRVGKIYHKLKDNGDHSNMYEFCISNKGDCLYFLENMLPFLLIKKEQAEYILNNFNFERSSNKYFDVDKFRSFITRKNTEKFRKHHTIKNE